MITSTSAALSGLSAHATMVEVAAGNLANLSTTGYKSSRVHLATQGSSTSEAGETGRGVQVAAIERSVRPGPLLSTGVPSDFAIQGEGFFQVQQNGGLAYTRDGAFHLDQNRYLVDASGNRLHPEIHLPPEAASFQVAPSGRVTAWDGDGQEVFSTSLTIETFPNPAGLNSLGHNDYEATTASGLGSTVMPGTAGAGAILQGVLEGPDVDPTREMVNLMVGQRGFEANLKAIQTADARLGEIINLCA